MLKRFRLILLGLLGFSQQNTGSTCLMRICNFFKPYAG